MLIFLQHNLYKLFVGSDLLPDVCVHIVLYSVYSFLCGACGKNEEKEKLAIKCRAPLSDVDGNYIPSAATCNVHSATGHMILEIKQPDRVQTVQFERKRNKVIYY